MVTCPECYESVEMINDSYLDEVLFWIILECPECGWRFLGKIRFDGLESASPIDNMED